MSQRGRGKRNFNNNNRGGSISRSDDRPTRRRSYEDIEREAIANSAKLETKIEEVKTSPAPVVNERKKTSLVSKGQQWFNKFFGGIKRRERGNMQLEFNSDLDLQIYDVYKFRLSNLAFSKNYYEPFHVAFSDDFFRIYLNMIIGMKLLKSNTDTGKVLMKEFQPLVHLDIKVPKNLAALINGIGKTDIPGENVVRIVGQNSIIKGCFFKASVLTAIRDEKRFYNNMIFQQKYTFDELNHWVMENLYQDKILRVYSEDKAGLDLLHSYGTQAIDFINKFDLNVGSDDEPVYIRVPYLNSKELDNLDAILEWEQKIRKLFTTIKFTGTQYMKTLGYALIGWFPLRFIKQRTKKLSELDVIFKNTIFKDVTTEQILTDQNWTCITDFMSEDELYHNIVTVADYYKSSIEDIYDDIFNMVKYEPTEFGNGSQICIINDHRKGNISFDTKSFQFLQADNKVPANVHARITDEEAVLGSIFDFNLGIRVENGFEVRTIGSAKEIRLAYLGHDFK